MGCKPYFKLAFFKFSRPSRLTKICATSLQYFVVLSIYLFVGANPLFGGLKSVKSVFGKSNYYWVEGEGMLHALYFNKDSENNWSVHYNNRYVETQSHKQETQKNKPSFIPITQGDVPAIISASLLNLVGPPLLSHYI